MFYRCEYLSFETHHNTMNRMYRCKQYFIVVAPLARVRSLSETDKNLQFDWTKWTYDWNAVSLMNIPIVCGSFEWNEMGRPIFWTHFMSNRKYLPFVPYFRWTDKLLLNSGANIFHSELPTNTQYRSNIKSFVVKEWEKNDNNFRVLNHLIIDIAQM